jgi:hypothetical protein
MNWMALIKWAGTGLVLVGIGLTSANVWFPLNLWLGFASCVLWGYAAIKMRENALLLIEIVAGIMYLAGILNAHMGA